MKNKFYSFLRTILILLSFLLLQNLRAQNSSGTFICFSDLHFNPFHNAALVDTLKRSPFEKWEEIFTALDKSQPGKYGEDTDHALFNSLIKELKTTDHNPDFIIYAGDFLAHHFLEEYRTITKDTNRSSSNAFILKTFEFIAKKIADAFPNCPVYFTLGNNDSYTGDYNSVWNGDFFKQTGAVLLHKFLKIEKTSEKIYSRYSESGCYAFPVNSNNSNYEIVSLNTNFLSFKCPKDQSKYGEDVLEWLSNTLEDAKSQNRKVILINHIPVGVDVYGTTRLVKAGQPLKRARLFLNDRYNERLVDLIIKFKNTIAVNFSGHIHTADFRLFENSKNPNDSLRVFTHIIPSVSPVFASNPAFQIFNYDTSTLSLLDYKTYDINLTDQNPEWKFEYDFNAAYHQNGINSRTLNSVFVSILKDSSMRKNYIKFYTSSSPIISIENNWLGYWCGISCITADEFVNEYNLKLRVK